MALYTILSNNDLANYRFGPTNEQTQLYNALGRSGYDMGQQDTEEANPFDFFIKKAKSLENAWGTTGAAVKEAGDLGSFIGAVGSGSTGDGHYDSATSLAQQAKTRELLNQGNKSLEDIYKEAGFNNADEYYNAKEAAEKNAFDKIGFNVADYWDKRADADIAGNKDEIARLDNEYNAAKAQLGNDETLAKFNDIQNRLQNANRDTRNAVAQSRDDYRDYAHNNYVSQKINQDQGKFLGSSINTLSTMLDLMAPGAGMAMNSIQGAAEGFADELEQNGFKDFDLGRATQNALIGAASGAATSGLNKGISNKLAKNGGNLFKGGNGITRGLNNLGANTAAGRIGSTLATGAARGAASGAVGGAVGGGLSAAMNGGDVIGSAIQGAQRGATSGAVAGGVMAGSGMAYNKAKDAFANSALGQKIDNMTMDDILTNSKKGFVKLPGGEDVETMKINNPYETEPENIKTYTQEEVALKNTPETEVYRTLTGEQEAAMPYGESELANRTRRGMLADSLERFGNSLEGAQTNVTRAARKDIGVKNTGEVIENVRKKTGLTNMETQAQFAKEITGGENSLMDRVQKNALANGEDGKPFLVDTSNVASEIESIVNKYADTNMFGSEKAKRAFIDNLRKDIGNRDTDVMTISNRMKTNAAELRGKGVGEVPAKDRAQAKIYSEIAQKLDDLSYKAIPQENVDNMFGATIEEMRARAVQAANNGNKDIARAWNTAADKLDAEPRTVAAFRKFKKDFVDVSKIDDLSAMAENGAAFQMGRGFGGGIKKFTSVFAQRPVNALLAKAGGAVNRLADRIDDSGTRIPNRTANVGGGQVIDAGTPVAALPSGEVSAPNTRIYDIIGRTEGLTNAEQARTADYLINAAQTPQTANTQATTLENLYTAPANTNASIYNAMTGNSGTTANTQLATNTGTTGRNSYVPKTGDYWTDIIGDAMSMAIDADDVEAFANLYQMYQTQLANLQKSASSTKDYSDVTNWNSSDRTKLLSAKDALGQIDQLESAYNDATGGGGGNVLQGNLRSFAAGISGGNLDPSANNYNKLAESVGMGIVKNLINLGVTEADAKRYLEYLPSLTDTKEQATQKLATLRNIYQTQINNLYSAYGA